MRIFLNVFNECERGLIELFIAFHVLQTRAYGHHLSDFFSKKFIYTTFNAKHKTEMRHLKYLIYSSNKPDFFKIVFSYFAFLSLPWSIVLMVLMISKYLRINLFDPILYNFQKDSLYIGVLTLSL